VSNVANQSVLAWSTREAKRKPEGVKTKKTGKSENTENCRYEEKTGRTTKRANASSRKTDQKQAKKGHGRKTKQ
jgi:hypothetical protein